jgi:hypothetical protein
MSSRKLIVEDTLLKGIEVSMDMISHNDWHIFEMVIFTWISSWFDFGFRKMIKSVRMQECYFMNTWSWANENILNIFNPYQNNILW